MYVRVFRWCVGIVGRLPQVMTSSHSRMVGPLASLVRWHRWQAARGHDVTTLAWLVRWHRWQLGIVGRLAARGHDVTCSRMVGALASLVRWYRWQAARGHDSRTALAWLVRWHRWSVGRLPEVMTSQLSHGTWSVGIVGRLPEVMTSHVHSPWLVRWQAARGHDVTRTLSMVGPLASLVRWQAARGHDVTHSRIGYLVRWHRCSVGIVGRLPDRS